MDYFPVFFNLKGQDCLVIGAGDIAARKIELLSRAGAKITVIAREISPVVATMRTSHSLLIYQKSFAPSDLKQFRLIISATDNIETNKLVAQTASEQRIPVNVVDNPGLSSFIFPAIVDRSPIVIAVSSGGAAPVLARLLRAKIESVIPPAYGRLASLAEKFRDRVKLHIKIAPQRRIFWENVFQGNIAEQVFSGNEHNAEKLLNQTLNNYDGTVNNGEVYLIGAGPGAADLLTFRALRLLQQADVVVYDRLVSPEIIDLARRDSEKIYVANNGKIMPCHRFQSINCLLI
jgi:uroporphyrin-III C-methyltransferase / precorrin-2 dehydrogenase / sirohydrochlorin ferrochelatase